MCCVFNYFIILEILILCIKQMDKHVTCFTGYIPVVSKRALKNV